MDRTKAIELLRNAVPAKSMPNEELGFFIEAVSVAISALEGKDTNVHTKEDAIPVEWLMKKSDWCDKNNNFFLSRAIRLTVDMWREEQNNGTNKP